NGDGNVDYAFVLFSSENNQVPLVVALSNGHQFDIVTLRLSDFKDRIYVSTIPAGRYTRTKSLDGPTSEAGELIEFASKT
ncbi:hypothetical protein, partial [Klebsiella aerogenes]|uniref:hypothetical protein n=1 Tax=Klebsiella aerogenes TaxID=548 RepID=UPI001CBF1647